MKYRIQKQYSEVQWGSAYYDLTEEEYNSLIEKYHLDPQGPSFGEELFNATATEYYLNYECEDYSEFHWESKASLDKWDD